MNEWTNDRHREWRERSKTLFAENVEYTEKSLGIQKKLLELVSESMQSQYVKKEKRVYILAINNWKMK